MNQLFVTLGIEAWKPWIAVLVMPPLPLLALVLVGLLWLPRRRVAGTLVAIVGLLGLWAQGCTVVGITLMHALLTPPPVLSPQRLAALAGQPDTAILVLGAGRRNKAPEWQGPDVSTLTAERLRYAVWLARGTSLPLAYTGGIGHGSPAGLTEAEVVRQVLQRDFQMTLRWAEDRSRDTNENARFSVPLLREAGVRRVALVTHGFHQRRALAAFARAQAQLPGPPIEIIPAPIQVPAGVYFELRDWLPSTAGYFLTDVVLHEWLGVLAGA